MKQKYYWIFGIIIVVIVGTILIVNNPFVKDNKSDGSKSLDFFLSDYCTPGNECDLDCVSDSDCVLLICGGFNFVAHKNAVDSLDNEKIINGWCSGTSQIIVSDELNVQCSSNRCILKS